MTRKKREIIERLSGLGKVYKEDNWLAGVSYSLLVEQEFLIAKSSSGSEIVPGLKDIRGQITVVEGERDLIINQEGPFTLHLDDGRKWKFHTSQRDPMSATYQVVNASGEGLVES